MNMKPSNGPAMTSDVIARVNAVAPIFLDGLAQHELDEVLAAATLRRLRADSVISRQGEVAEELFVLLEGHARHFTMTPEGRKIVVLWLHPGDAYGGRAMLTKRPVNYLVSTETVEEGCALIWKHDALVTLEKRIPQLLENALLIASNYLSIYRDLHVAASYSKANERVRWVLRKLIKEIGKAGDGGIELKIRNEEVANEANVTIFTVSRLLNEWQRKGFLEKGRGKIVIRSLEGLE